MRSTYGWLHPSEPAASANNGNHDARLLYIMDLASRRAHNKKKERGANVIAVDVIRHWFACPSLP